MSRNITLRRGMDGAGDSAWGDSRSVGMGPGITLAIVAGALERMS